MNNLLKMSLINFQMINFIIYKKREFKLQNFKILKDQNNLFKIKVKLSKLYQNKMIMIFNKYNKIKILRMI